MSASTSNSVVIEAPLELTWQMTNDLDSWTQLFTEYQECTVLERSGNTFTFRLTTHPDENGKAWSWVSERTLDPVTHQVRAHRVETGPFDFMKLHWTYEPVPEGTRMNWFQEFAMKPTAPVDDEQMAARINRNSPVQMAAIKAKVEAAAQDPHLIPVPRHEHSITDPSITSGCCAPVALADQPVDTRRGGSLRVLLGPKTVGSTSGFMGVLDLEPQETLAEHYHPYSEEFIYLVEGSLEVDLDGQPRTVHAEQALFVPRFVRHRLRNVGNSRARAVFQCGPLAPRPQIGHVDTEGKP